MPEVDAPRRTAKLTQFLIAKSIIETIFVTVLAVGFYLTAFPPFIRGIVDTADAQHIAGWVVDQSDPYARIEVHLYIDGKFVASQRADQSRPDVKAAGLSQDEWHGFSFDTPKPLYGEHVAEVYSMHESGRGRRRVLQLVGKPRHLVLK